MLEGAIDVPAVADFDDIYDELVFFDSVHDAILALTDSIAVLARDLLTPRRASTRRAQHWVMHQFNSLTWRCDASSQLWRTSIPQPGPSGIATLPSLATSAGS